MDMRKYTDRLFFHFPGKDEPGFSTGIAIALVLLGIQSLWPVQPVVLARWYWLLAPFGMLCVYVGFSIIYWDTKRWRR